MNDDNEETRKLVREWGFETEFSREKVGDLGQPCDCCRSLDPCKCTFQFTSKTDKDKPNLSYTYLECKLHMEIKQ